MSDPLRWMTGLGVLVAVSKHKVPCLVHPHLRVRLPGWGVDECPRVIGARSAGGVDQRNVLIPVFRRPTVMDVSDDRDVSASTWPLGAAFDFRRVPAVKAAVELRCELTPQCAERGGRQRCARRGVGRIETTRIPGLWCLERRIVKHQAQRQSHATGSGIELDVCLPIPP